MSNSDRAWYFAGGFGAAYFATDHGWLVSLGVFAIVFPLGWFLYWGMEQLHACIDRAVMRVRA